MHGKGKVIEAIIQLKTSLTPHFLPSVLLDRVLVLNHFFEKKKNSEKRYLIFCIN